MECLGARELRGARAGSGAVPSAALIHPGMQLVRRHRLVRVSQTHDGLAPPASLTYHPLNPSAVLLQSSWRTCGLASSSRFAQPAAR